METKLQITHEEINSIKNFNLPLLQEANLRYADLTGANLTDASIDRSDLLNVKQ